MTSDYRFRLPEFQPEKRRGDTATRRKTLLSRTYALLCQPRILRAAYYSASRTIATVISFIAASPRPRVAASLQGCAARLRVMRARQSWARRRISVSLSVSSRRSRITTRPSMMTVRTSVAFVA